MPIAPFIDRLGIGSVPVCHEGDVSEVPVGSGAVPKTGQKNASPREDATEASVGRVAVPKPGIIIDK